MTTPTSDPSDKRTRVDVHFDVTEFLLAHPEVLAALPDGAEFTVDSTEAIWLRVPSVVESTGTVVSGTAPQHTTISGATIDGARPATHGQVIT